MCTDGDKFVGFLSKTILSNSAITAVNKSHTKINK